MNFETSCILQFSMKIRLLPVDLGLAVDFDGNNPFSKLSILFFLQDFSEFTVDLFSKKKTKTGIFFYGFSNLLIQVGEN